MSQCIASLANISTIFISAILTRRLTDGQHQPTVWGRAQGIITRRRKKPTDRARLGAVDQGRRHHIISLGWGGQTRIAQHKHILPGLCPLLPQCPPPILVPILHLIEIKRHGAGNWHSCVHVFSWGSLITSSFLLFTLGTSKVCWWGIYIIASMLLSKWERTDQ